MKVGEFFNNYHIKIEDIKSNFNLVREFDVPMRRENACENCDAIDMNTYSYPTTPWQGVKHCRLCESIIVTHYQDAMGGISHDVINVYK